MPDNNFDGLDAWLWEAADGDDPPPRPKLRRDPDDPPDEDENIN